MSRELSPSEMRDILSLIDRLDGRINDFGQLKESNLAVQVSLVDSNGERIGVIRVGEVEPDKLGFIFAVDNADHVC